MGIKSSGKLLSNIGSTVYIKQLAGKCIAVDMLSYCIRAYIPCGCILKEHTISCYAEWKRNMTDFIRKFTLHNIKLVCIFDGPERPPEKKKRLKKQLPPIVYYVNAVSVSNLTSLYPQFKDPEEIYDHILDNHDEKAKALFIDKKQFIGLYHLRTRNYDALAKLYPDRRLFPDVSTELEQGTWSSVKYVPREFPKRESLDVMRVFLETLVEPNFSFKVAKGEAESLCCHCLITNECDYVLSEDSDVFAYGAERVLRKFSPFSDKVTKVILTDVLSRYNVTFEEFQKACILLGTDYNSKGFHCRFAEVKDALLQGTLYKLVDRYTKHNGVSLDRMRELFTPQQ